MLIKEKALAQALKTLDALGCDYKVITEDGNQYGMLQVYEPKRKRNTEYEFGARSAYIRPFIESLEVGQTVVIPQGDFKARDLQGSVSSMSHKLWGVGSYTTVINGDAVELLRIA